MKYVLDTNVVSAARKHSEPVARWLAGKSPGDLFISVLTLGEIARGAELKRRKDPLAAGYIDAWLEKTRRAFAARTLPVTEAIAEEWGRLSALRMRGHHWQAPVSLKIYRQNFFLTKYLPQALTKTMQDRLQSLSRLLQDFLFLQ